MLSLTNLPLPSAILLFSLTTYLVWRIVEEFFFSPFKSIPGPFLAKFTRLWEVVDIAKKHPDETLLALHAKHGTFLSSVKRTGLTGYRTRR